ncbi:MAG: LPS export ABC transporter periplasmic protein LptC [Alphaproteobacteria bacterium]
MSAETAPSTPPKKPIRRTLLREYGRARALVAPTDGTRASLIRTLRFVLPGIAVLLIVAVAAWPLLQSRIGRIPIGFATITQDEINQQRMINPRYVGVDDRNQPFTITATTATKIDTKGNLVELDQPKADMALKDGHWVALTAATGTFSQDAQLIQLVDSVSLFHDSGYEFHTQTAYIDVKAGTAYGQDPIQGQGPLGTLKAEGFRIYDKGERVVFTGRAHMVLQAQRRDRRP